MINWTPIQGQLTLKRSPELQAFDLLFLLTLNEDLTKLAEAIRKKEKIGTPEIIITNALLQAVDGNLIKITGNSKIWGSDQATVSFTYEKETGAARQIDISKVVAAFDTGMSIGDIKLENWQQHLKVVAPPNGGLRSGLMSYKYTGILQIKDRISIPFSIENPSGTESYMIETGISRNQGNQATPVKLEHLNSLLGGEGESEKAWKLFPDEMRSAITNSVDIANLKIQIFRKSIATIETTFHLPVKWPVFPDLLSVNDLWIGLEVDYPLEAEYRFFKFRVGGTLQIGDGKAQQAGNIDIIARWPDLSIRGALRQDETIPIGHIAANLGLAIPQSMEKMAVDQLFFSAEPTSNPKTFAFSIGIRDILDTGKVKIEDLRLAVGYTGSKSTGSAATGASQPARLNGRFSGRFALLGIEFSVSTQRVSSGAASSWIFEGSADGSNTSIGKLVREFSADTDVPRWLSDATIKVIRLKYDTGAKDFSFSCDIDARKLLGPDTDVELIIDLALRRTNPEAMPPAVAAYEKAFSGRMLFTLADGPKLEFDLLFDLKPTAAGAGDQLTFIAAYQNLAGGDISIGALASKIDPGLNIPLTLRLKDAFLIYDKTGTAAADVLFGLDIDSGINLSNLPLIGQLLGADQTLRIGLQPLIASGAGSPIFRQERLAQLQVMAPTGGITLPATDILASVSLAINLTAGATVRRIDLPLVLNKSAQPLPAGQTPPAAGQQQPIGEALTDAGDPQKLGPPLPRPAPGNNAPVTTPDGIRWMDLQQSFGPVQFNRAGFAYSDSRIHVYLDAALGLGGLTLTLDGLGMSTPIQPIKPHFFLQGLGLDYRQGPMEIGGSFLRTNVPAGGDLPAYDAYDGMAILKIQTFSISALGSYSRVNGQHSLFIYAVLDYPLGGPSFFFVTGLAAGFGYNRAVRVPDIGKVGQFPLVNEAVNGAGGAPPADDAGRRLYLQNELGRLRSAIYPKAGEYFLTAGIRFSSFEMIDSFAMLTIRFGQHFEVDILGLSTLLIPTPEAGKTVTPVAEVQMALKAAFNPEEGVISVQAQLTGNAFLFSRACHLTGGFAFYCWFQGEHKGDFVITLGGYHPRFVVPAHYPSVPRLGFNWVINDKLSVKGEAYFALTAHALMAGGRLEALFQDGGIRAWFIAGADFIISWKPYFYDARLYIDIGASYTFSLVGTHTISVSLGADLHIWGPDFSGKAKIHFYVVSVTISFGDAAPKPDPIDWPTFKASFLPDRTKICSVSIAGGLIKEEGQHAVINPRDFALSVNTPVPVSTYELNLQKGPAATAKDRLYYADAGGRVLLGIGEDTDTSHSVSTAAFGIAPMNVAAVGESRMTITIRNEEGKPVNQDFTFLPVLKRMPKALWGDKLGAEANGAQFVENALAGFTIRPATPGTPGETHPALKKALQYEPDKQPAFQFAAAKSFGRNGDRAPDLRNIRQLEGARRKLLRGLGFNVHALELDVPPDIETVFVRPPQAGSLV